MQPRFRLLLPNNNNVLLDLHPVAGLLFFLFKFYLDSTQIPHVLSGEGHTAGRGDYSGPTSLLTSRDLWGFTRKRTHHFSNNRAGRKKGKGPSRGTLNMTDALGNRRRSTGDPVFLFRNSSSLRKEEEEEIE